MRRNESKVGRFSELVNKRFPGSSHKAIVTTGIVVYYIMSFTLIVNVMFICNPDHNT